jgi:AraC-like DNA-binding protein
MAVEKIFTDNGYHPQSIELGEVDIQGDLNTDAIQKLDADLKQLGFEIIDDRKSRIIEKIKNLIVSLVYQSDKPLNINISDYLSREMNYEYNYLSNLFSEVEGNTIEKYFINQKIERVKELLIYDELTLSEIAFKLGYSSVAYLSTQFKKITGLTPGYFKAIKAQKRRNIEEL